MQTPHHNHPLTTIFASGDGAESGGPKMARAGQFQSDIVQANIVAMVKGQHPCITYKPRVDVEGAIKLTLGKVGAKRTSPVVCVCSCYHGLTNCCLSLSQ